MESRTETQGNEGVATKSARDFETAFETIMLLAGSGLLKKTKYFPAESILENPKDSEA